MGRSFPLVARRLTRRQALLLFLLPILAGCGGDGHPKASAGQPVSGQGFRFMVPDGWKVTRTQNGVTAADGGRLVEVSTFPLARAYSTGLFAAVAKELNARMATLAQQSGGTVTPRKPVTVAAIRSHSYQVESDGMVDSYVFVLRGKREFQLLCRRKSSDSEEPCKLLLTSFHVT